MTGPPLPQALFQRGNAGEQGSQSHRKHPSFGASLLRRRGNATSARELLDLSLELGGPRQFGPHGPDPEFDRKAVDWIATGDLERCLAEVTLESLHAPGNATHGFMDFMLMMGVAGENAKADHVDSLDLFHTMEAYFTWYPNGVPA